MDVNGVEQLSPEAAQERIKAGALMVDVRETEERAQARIPGTVAMPLSVLSQRWAELPKDRALILQCAAGMRSQQAAQFLLGQGYSVANLSQGIGGWYHSGQPVDTQPAR